MSEPAHKRLLSRIALGVIFSITHIPLGLLQVGIWASMFDQFYEETRSIILSAEWTLDGLHRCSGCELVDKLGSDTNEAISQLKTFSFETKLVKLRAHCPYEPDLPIPELTTAPVALFRLSRIQRGLCRSPNGQTN